MRVLSIKLGVHKSEFSIEKHDNAFIGLINGVQVCASSDYQKVSDQIMAMAETEKESKCGCDHH